MNFTVAQQHLLMSSVVTGYRITISRALGLKLNPLS